MRRLCQQCGVNEIQGKCPITKKLVCGRECQIDAHVAFIQGTDDDDDGSLCLNSEDPITLDEISTLDKRLIIKIGPHCFHLPSLYQWVVNEEQNKNPSTNKNFDDNDILHLHKIANDRFPLILPKVSLSGARPDETYRGSSLITLERLVINVCNIILPINHRVNSLREAFINISAFGARITFLAENDGVQKSFTMTEILTDFGKSTQVYTIPYVFSRFMVNMLLTPPSALHQTESFISYIENMLHQPVPQQLEAKRDSLRNILQEAELANQRQTQLIEFMRAKRNARNYIPAETPNSYKVNISITTNQGQAYGTFYIWVPHGSTLGSMRPLMEAEIGDAFQLPNRPMRVLFAGRSHSLNTIIDTLAQNRNEPLTLFVVF